MFRLRTERRGLGQHPLGPLWRQRYWLACRFVDLALLLMPECRYKRDLLDRMYELRWHVEDTVRTSHLGGHDERI